MENQKSKKMEHDMKICLILRDVGIDTYNLGSFSGALMQDLGLQGFKAFRGKSATAWLLHATVYLSCPFWCLRHEIFQKLLYWRGGVSACKVLIALAFRCGS